jgi:hypothetical protein
MKLKGQKKVKKTANRQINKIKYNGQKETFCIDINFIYRTPADLLDVTTAILVSSTVVVLREYFRGYCPAQEGNLILDA